MRKPDETCSDIGWLVLRILGSCVLGAVLVVTVIVMSVKP